MTDDEVIQFPLKAQISGPMTIDAEEFKANLAAAFKSGELKAAARITELELECQKSMEEITNLRADLNKIWRQLEEVGSLKKLKKGSHDV